MDKTSIDWDPVTIRMISKEDFLKLDKEEQDRPILILEKLSDEVKEHWDWVITNFEKEFLIV